MTTILCNGECKYNVDGFCTLKSINLKYIDYEGFYCHQQSILNELKGD